MKISLNYGKSSIPVNIPDNRIQNILELEKPEDEHFKTLPESLETNQKNGKFKEFMEHGNKFLIVVNDGTRATPTSRVLDVILPEIQEKIQEGHVCFLIATGSHSAPKKNELETIFGRHLDTKDNLRKYILFHDSLNDEMVNYGKTSRGTPIEFNFIVTKFDSIIVIGSVEPHYFAGYTGGRKSLLPGISSHSSIQKNHAMALEKKSKSLNLQGNPVHEDMKEAISVFSEKHTKLFSIQIILDKDHSILGAESGDIHTSFSNAAGLAKNVYTAPIQKKADIVITVQPPPMDLNLYQSQKALENGRHALKKNGIILLVSQCRDGVGNETFLELMKKGGEPSKVLELTRKNYKLGFHKSAKLASLAEYAEIWAYTSVPEKILEKAFIKPVEDLRNAVEQALELKPKGKVIIIPDGSITVPKLENEIIPKSR